MEKTKDFLFTEKEKTQENTSKEHKNNQTKETNNTNNMATREYVTRNKAKGPYTHTSLPQTQKRQKKDTTSQEQQTQQQNQIATGHVTQTRDVIISENTFTQNVKQNEGLPSPNVAQSSTATAQATVIYTESPNFEQTKETDPLADEILDDVNWENVFYNTRHALLIMADNIEGDGLREKRRIMEKIIPMGIRYVRTCVKRINNVTYIKIDFPTHEHMEKMATLFDTKNIKYEVNDYKKRSLTQNDRKNEIVVKDIPLETSQMDIEKHFSSYGDIETIRVKALNQWHTANITFKDTETASIFNNKWSDIVKKDSVRIYTAENFEENKNTRTEFCAKLCNLPRNTTGFDIDDFIKQQGGKTCFIPRHPESYNRLRYAYVCFEKQEDLDKVLYDTKEYYLRNFRVFWTQEKSKNCNICQSPEHLAKNCPRKNDRRRNEKRITKLAALYERKNVETTNAKTVINKAIKINSKKSYSQVATEAHASQTINTRLDNMESRMNRIEKLLETALFALQQIIKKGEDREELENFRKSIKERDSINAQTPSKKNPPNRPQPTPGNLAQSIHAPNSKGKQTAQLTPPIKDNTLTIASETRMVKLEALVTKVFNILETCTITPKITQDTQQTNDNMDTSTPSTSNQ